MSLFFLETPRDLDDAALQGISLKCFHPEVHFTISFTLFCRFISGWRLSPDRACPRITWRRNLRMRRRERRRRRCHRRGSAAGPWQWVFYFCFCFCFSVACFSSVERAVRKLEHLNHSWTCFIWIKAPYVDVSSMNVKLTQPRNRKWKVPKVADVKDVVEDFALLELSMHEASSENTWTSVKDALGNWYIWWW